jgi:hypothetical protein
MARPRKPLAWHLLTGNYRPSWHGPLPQAVNGAVNGAVNTEPIRRIAAFEDLPADAQAWSGLLELGDNFFYELPHGVTEKQARRMAREVWHELGPVLTAFWGEERTRSSWAWKRWGAP